MPLTRSLDPRHYRNVFDGVQDILYVRDMDGVLLDVNEAGARFFGKPREELIGRTLHRQMDDEQARSLKATNDLLLREGVDRSTVELRNRAGEVRIVETTTTLIRDDDGTPHGAYGVMRDVTESVRLHELLTREIEDARIVHRALLPREMPQCATIDVAVHTRTASEVGGDYYDFSTGEDGSLTIAIGDATGHGLRAAILGATAKSYFHTLSKQCSPREILEAMSSAFQHLALPSLYMCLMIARIQARQASIVGAGMPPFLVRRRSGAIERIEVAGFPLGVRRKPVFDGTVLDFDPGTAMLLFSDGLPELPDAQERELGYDAIAETFRTADATSAQSMLDPIVRLADEWCGGRASADDLTVMVVQATG